MVLKIKADVLKDFFVKTTADGFIKDSKMVFKDDGLHMIHKDEDGIIMVCGVLSKTNFSGYEPIEITIKDNKNFITALKSFKDNVINIVKQEIEARIFDENGGFDLTLAENVVCVKDAAPDLKYDNVALLKKSMIDTLMERNSIIAAEELTINIKDKKIKLTIGKESDGAYTESITTIETEKKACLLLDIFKTMSSSFDTILDMSIGDEGIPSMFEEKTDKYNIKYFITPISEEDMQKRSVEKAPVKISETKIISKESDIKEKQEKGEKSG